MLTTKLVLASESPRRRELLGLFEIPFNVCASHLDETQAPAESPLDYVRRLALAKGSSVSAEEGEWVLSADTVVVFDGQVLGKPASVQAARDMLTRLRGNTHTVFTALCLQNRAEASAYSTVCQSEVCMRAYTDAEIEAYIQSGSYRDKAGGYAIQDREFHPAESSQGCYANVMGLPLCHLARALSQAGISLDVDIPSRCQAALEIECRVNPQILNETVPFCQPLKS